MFVHCTVEHGRKFVPVRLSVTPELPAVALDGEIDAMDGAAGEEGAVTVKSIVFEVAGAFAVAEPVVTVIGMPGGMLAKAMSDAEISAVSCVEPTNVVWRPLPFQFTTEPFTKFTPFTVSVIPDAVQEGVEGGVAFGFADDDKDAILGGLITKFCDAGHDVGAMLNTSTQAL